MSVGLFLFFPDTGSNPPTYTSAGAMTDGFYFDCSGLLLNQFTIDQSVFNREFKHVVNKCSVRLANSNLLLFEKLLNNNSIIKFKLYEGATLVFDGIVRPQLNIALQNGFNALELEAVDISYVLDVMTSFPITVENKKLHSNTKVSGVYTNSAIYEILSQVLPNYGFTVPEIANVDTEDTISLVTAPPNTKLSQFLDELFFGYGWQYSFVAGVLTPVKWRTSTTATNTITNVSDGTLQISRKDGEEDCVRVEAYFCDQNSCVVVNSATQFSVSNAYPSVPVVYYMSPAASTEIKGLQFSPQTITFQHRWVTNEWVWDWFSSGFRSVEHTSTHSATLINGSAVSTGSGEDSYTVLSKWGTQLLNASGNPDSTRYNQIEVSIKLNSDHYSTLQKLQISGVAVVATNSPTIINASEALLGPKKFFKTYKVSYIAGSGTTNNGTQFAQRLADALQKNLTSNPLLYSFDSEVSYALGENYTLSISDDTMNASIPAVDLKIVSKNVQSKMLKSGALFKVYSYEAVALSPSDIDTSILHRTQIFTSPPPLENAPFVNGITNEALQQVEAAITTTGLYLTKDVMGFYDSDEEEMTNYFSAYGDFRVGRGLNTMVFNPTSDTLTLTGTVVAGAGLIGGFTIGATSLTAGTGSNTVGMDSGGTNPVFYAGSATPGSAPYRVTKAGVLTATSGTVGGFTLSSTTLSGTNLSIVNTGDLSLGTSNDLVRLSSSDATYRLWVGHATAASAPTSLTKAGLLKTTSASIGAFAVNSTSISATNLTLTSGVANTANITVGTGSTAGGLNSAASGSDVIFWGGSTFANRATAPYRVLADGSGYASNLTIAAGATIGSWVVTASSLDSGAIGTARIKLNKTDNRIEVLDSSNAVKTATGYLGGLPIQGSPWQTGKTYSAAGGEYVSYLGVIYKSKAVASNIGRTPPNATYWLVSTDTYSASNYGFYSGLGNTLSYTGDTTFTNGTMLLQNDASFVVNASSTPVLRMGTYNGTIGFFASEQNTGSNFRARLTASDFFVGNDSNYLSFASGALSLLLTSFKVSSTLTSTLGSIEVSQTGSIATLTNQVTLTADATSGRLNHGTKLDLLVGSTSKLALTSALTTSANPLSIADTSAATSITNGAFRVSGGASVEGSVLSGGLFKSMPTSGEARVHVVASSGRDAYLYSNSTTWGLSDSVGGVMISRTLTDNRIDIGVSTGRTRIPATTTTTSTSTGALVVVGGVGFGGGLNVAGKIQTGDGTLDTNPYGYLGVSRPNNANSYPFFAMTRNANVSWQLGIQGSSGVSTNALFWSNTVLGDDVSTYMMTLDTSGNLSVASDVQTSGQYTAVSATGSYGALVPAGSVVFWTTSSIPVGWLDCNGQAISRTTYSRLFAIVGTTYGAGDGTTTFNVPDLRSASVRGVGTPTRFTANTAVTLNQTINDQMETHTHSLSLYGTTGGSGMAVGSGLVTPSTRITSDNSGRSGTETTGKAVGLYYIIKD